MSGRLDDLERLVWLRRRGALTENEFQTQKAKLLETRPANDGTAYWQRNRRWITPLTALAGVGLAAFVIKPLFADGAAEGPGAPTWAVNESKDPMSDVKLMTATKEFVTPTAKIVMAITCGSTGELTYRATSFDKDDAPVEMRRRISPSGYASVPFGFRVDGQTATYKTSVQNDYSNVATLEYKPIDQSPPGYSWYATDRLKVANDELGDVRARRITFVFHLANSDETVVVDQEEEGIVDVRNTCANIQAQAINQFRSTKFRFEDRPNGTSL